MTIVALDSTSRAGSLALWRDGMVIASRPGDPTVSHSTRLPGDLLRLLADHDLTLAEATHLALALGPGSLTGLRVGVATMQGLAMAAGVPVVGVSALDAMAWMGLTHAPSSTVFVASCKDAARQEVFTALHRVTPPKTVEAPGVPGLTTVESPRVGTLDDVLDRWRPIVADQRLVLAADRGVLQAGDWSRLGASVDPVQAEVLAPAIAVLAAHRASRGEAGPPHALRPLYVRRPDAEVARARRLTTPDRQRR
ncbi:MAG: tRNA (adenosine(37)-N6)-threonylcarbamoyltransferase complex dimerization subunit type 1 TsaB [Acidobacteria bacterium]|nr:tRNA (adenosine(37)-N6)-threonylcarbamoyltransferase complex dimerization subunit type 1 TsaB [Acidobacteriota bacterium]